MHFRTFIASFLTAATLLAASPVHADVAYSVRRGDSLDSICKAFGLTPSQVRQANPGLGADVIPGTVLVLPEKDEAVGQGADRVEDPILIAGISYDPPKATSVDLEAATNPQKISDIPARHRRPQMNARRGRLLHGVTSAARRFIGVPYSMGGTTSRAFDCSGFVMRVFLINGIQLPRTADVQYGVGSAVKKGEEQPGDLVFFETYLPGPSHVGIYLGNRSFIHASSSKGVTISTLDQDYFKRRYLGAKRVF